MDIDLAAAWSFDSLPLRKQEEREYQVILFAEGGTPYDHAGLAIPELPCWLGRPSPAARPRPSASAPGSTAVTMRMTMRTTKTTRSPQGGLRTSVRVQLRAAIARSISLDHPTNPTLDSSSSANWIACSGACSLPAITCRANATAGC